MLGFKAIVLIDTSVAYLVIHPSMSHMAPFNLVRIGLVIEDAQAFMNCISRCDVRRPTYT